MKIGVFDSGIGGKLIARQIKLALPKTQIIFKSDPGYFPYGNKTTAVILRRLIHFSRWFQDQSCRFVVIACNSATTNTISQLRRRFLKLTFIGIEPPIKPLAQLTRTRRVAIMATPVTLRSRRTNQLIRQFATKIKVYKVSCLGLAEAIEVNSQPRLETAKLLHEFLDPAIAGGVDVVGIACTHYPYLIDQMRQLYPQVLFYDPAAAIVAQVLKLTHDSLAKI